MFISYEILIALCVCIVWLCFWCYDLGWDDGYSTLEKLYKAMKQNL